jgi:hypothetical protein
MALWEARERRRLETLAAVDEAEASLARGEGRSITTHEEVTELAADVKRREPCPPCIGTIKSPLIGRRRTQPADSNPDDLV